jgi:hypothetical protein
MKEGFLNKGFVIAVIFLFVAVSFQPIIAKDTISPIKKSDTKELIETIKDLANNKEFQSIIQKYEINSSPIKFQQLLGLLQKEIIGAIENNNVHNERLEQLSDLPCDCEKDDITRLWPFPIICATISVIYAYLNIMYLAGTPMAKAIAYYFFYFIIRPIAIVLDCFWYPPYN